MTEGGVWTRLFLSLLAVGYSAWRGDRPGRKHKGPNFCTRVCKRRRTLSGARRKSARGLTDERETYGKARAKLLPRSRSSVAGSGIEASRRPDDLPCIVPEHRRSHTVGEKFNKPGFRLANGLHVRCRVDLFGCDR